MSSEQNPASILSATAALPAISNPLPAQAVENAKITLQGKKKKDMGSPHALLLPYPAQGHVIPLMELGHRLVDRGFKVTFINTEFNHDRIVAALPKRNDLDRIHLVTIPDGLKPGEDRNDVPKLTETMLNVIPDCLKELVLNVNKSGKEKITCFVVDWIMAWTLKVVQKMGIRSAVFWAPCPAMLMPILSIPKLIDDGIIDENGEVNREEMICLGPGIPAVKSSQLYWNSMLDSKTREIMFRYTVKSNQALGIADFLISNWFENIQLPSFTPAPKFLPVGPLLADQQLGKLSGSFWPEDFACTTWLDEQPLNSVIYVALGSQTIINRRQFEELALGLELTGRPFLWVVRSDLTDSLNGAYPDGFRDRIAKQGRIVSWSPQKTVLSHPSMACFISHCGWNSTIEGVWNGLPFLCWPHFSEQFLNASYICDVWGVGLRLTPDDDSGIVSRELIKSKVETLLGDEDFRDKALALKEMSKTSVSKGGSSYENLNAFAEAMKE